MMGMGHFLLLLVTEDVAFLELCLRIEGMQILSVGGLTRQQ